MPKRLAWSLKTTIERHRRIIMKWLPGGKNSNFNPAKLRQELMEIPVTYLDQKVR